MAPKGDSGIYLRNVPQVQIWDATDPDGGKLGREKGSGGLWNNAAGHPGKDPLVLADKPAGEWNKFRILMVGSRVSVWLNDKMVVDHAILENYYDNNDKSLAPEARRPIPARGPICLQTHGAPIRWRNIFIREIGSTEADKILASHGASAEFKPVFDGKSLEGWAGPGGELRGRGRRDPVQGQEGRHNLLESGFKGLCRAARVQGAGRREQRPGDSVSRAGRHRLQRNV
jgi:hypothetical protein